MTLWQHILPGIGRLSDPRVEGPNPRRKYHPCMPAQYCSVCNVWLEILKSNNQLINKSIIDHKQPSFLSSTIRWTNLSSTLDDEGETQNYINNYLFLLADSYVA